MGDRNLGSDSRQPEFLPATAICALRKLARIFFFTSNINVFVDHPSALRTVKARQPGSHSHAIAIKHEQIAALKEYKTSLINAAVTGKIKVA